MYRPNKYPRNVLGIVLGIVPPFGPGTDPITPHPPQGLSVAAPLTLVTHTHNVSRHVGKAVPSGHWVRFSGHDMLHTDVLADVNGHRDLRDKSASCKIQRRRRHPSSEQCSEGSECSDRAETEGDRAEIEPRVVISPMPAQMGRPHLPHV